MEPELWLGFAWDLSQRMSVDSDGHWASSSGLHSSVKRHHTCTYIRVCTHTHAHMRTHMQDRGTETERAEEEKWREEKQLHVQYKCNFFWLFFICGSFHSRCEAVSVSYLGQGSYTPQTKSGWVQMREEPAQARKRSIFQWWRSTEGHLPLPQWFPPFLVLLPFNTVPHAVLTSNHNVIFVATS